ncbi:HAMP domain-containing sensor histidine kinase [Sulfitobacter sp. R18_1]|uniref:sensor histidine kinase n=1 Tax=Sulfitobacter sp. R18_1 TaxID=2821104 RepID=UPI001ADCB4FB|nr:HAMP domain-containing sensor histidine kinase [Sulfitobacter sp. R18_1]MBO9428100.1 HAMP domain-containing histidine kinase [Sulfitobacter sp. R18_1]
MNALTKLQATWLDWFNPEGREQKIKDYIALANKFIWKRQGSFLAAAILAAIYFDAITVFGYYSIVVLTELLDVRLGWSAKNWDGQDLITGRKILKRIAINTTISAVAISAFIINIAVQQAAPGHFTPLFFMLSASVFAAMYNSQMSGILLLRLSIYMFAFVYIALLDVFRFTPPLSSNIWLELWTVIFVLYFIGDIAMKFYLGYQWNIKQMDRLKEENERTKAALEVKSQFLSVVSHELRTPLTSIIGSLELMKNNKAQAFPDSLMPVLNIAARNGHRLHALVEDLLDLQKLEAGEMVFEFKPMDAGDLVREAIDATAGYASKVGVQVEIDACEEGCVIKADQKRLIQVLNNLLSNALKFSDEGAVVTVNVSAIDDRVRISVQDEGVGIPDGVRDVVFGKFTQVDSSDIRKVGGTGLGLNISQQIIERHDAEIDYVSEVGKGTTFHLEFNRLTDATGDSETFRDVTQAA